MSLDVYLRSPDNRAPVVGPRIFIREDGGTREVTRAEWDEMHPGQEPTTFTDSGENGEVFWANITHNLTRMADAAGLYEPLWRPDATHARDLVEPLSEGLERLLADPEGMREHDPPNGWGDYDVLVNFTTNYLCACRQWPDAEVEVSR